MDKECYRCGDEGVKKLTVYNPKFIDEDETLVSDDVEFDVDYVVEFDNCTIELHNIKVYLCEECYHKEIDYKIA